MAESYSSTFNNKTILTKNRQQYMPPDIKDETDRSLLWLT